MLVVAVVFGIGLGNGRTAGLDALRPGLAWAARTPLRLGVALLGFRLAIGDVATLGLPILAMVVATVAATFFGTQALGRRLGLSQGLSLLVATGYSICGASAIAAMEPSADADDEEVAMSIGLVTLAGTVAMFALPIMAGLLGLSSTQAGAWIGASVHDVAQVVAAASAAGPEALSVAVVVKLTRVMLLAPIVTGVTLRRTRRDHASMPAQPQRALPTFVVGFLAAMVLRSLGVVPAAVVDAATTTSSVLFAIALVGLGAGVRIDRLRRLGAQPLLLGLAAWVLIASVSLAGVLLATR